MKPSSGANVREASAAAGSAAADATWLPADGCPYGVPVLVRDASGDSATAIRNHHFGWYNESRSGPIAFTPSEFQSAN